MLKVDQLSKQYATPSGSLTIIDNVSFEVDRAQAVAIMGPSGCGKSTLLYMLGGLEPPSSGTVTLDGENPYSLSEAAQAEFRGKHVGFVFQDHLLLPQLTAVENVLAPALAMAKDVKADQHELQRRALYLLLEVGLEDRADHRPGELSGGERQRVAIARALMRQPSVLLCDEPTGNLDRAAAGVVSDLLVRLYQAQRTMLVVVTHSQALAERFDRRYELNGGTLQKQA
jgi:lipoprotein-releasing system ATP-binding protein